MIAIEPLNTEGRARHRCDNCGLVTAPILPTSADKVHCRCRRSPPGIIQQAVNFIPAAVAHLRGGMKLVSDEIRASRLATCEACELFNGTVCTHPSCGCPVKQKRAFIDKIGWESSTCPLAKW